MRHHFASRVLLVGAIIATGVVGVAAIPAGAQPSDFQTACPGLAGLTIQWEPSSTWNLPGVGHGDWSGTVTIADNGTVSGSVTSSIGGSATVAGSIVDVTGAGATACETLSYVEDGSGGWTIQSVGDNDLLPGPNNTLVLNANFLGERGQSSYPGGTAVGIGQAVPTVSVTPPSPPALPSTPGPVTYNVTVTGTAPAVAAFTPTGTVSVNDGTPGGTCTPIDPVSLTAGSATCTIPSESSPGPYTITASYSGDQNYTSATGAITMNTGISNGDVTDSTVVDDASDGVTVAGNGGVSGSDTATEVAYGSDPVGNLNDGTNYFDVEVSQPSGFTSNIIQDCNSNVTTSTVLQWWGGSSWQDVSGDTSVLAPEPYYSTVNGAQCVSYALDNTTSPSLAQLTGTVFGAVPSLAIDSVDSAVARTGKRFSLTVTTTGSPTPSITETGPLPSGLHLVDNHDGTATLSGTPTVKSGGLYQPTIRATFGSGPTAVTVTQLFTLFVFRAPTIATRHIPSATVGSFYQVTLKAKGSPPPTMTESGALPNGVAFTDNHNGTATLSGTPGPGSTGTYMIKIGAANGEGRSATKRFDLVVKS
jgi:hypothetical protein